MKRFFRLLGVAAFVGVFNIVLIVVAVGVVTVKAGPTASGNGDINGDGSINVGDAVALLSYIFEGGTPPVAIAGPPGLTPEHEEILSHMSIEYLDDGLGGTNKTIRFTGVNVQVVNGLGATNGNPADPAAPAGTVNGLGNLIVGYNEAEGSQDRTGSHNVVTGTLHDYSSFGGLVAGHTNTVSGPWSSVSGGVVNEASGLYSTVSGGIGNTASGLYSSVSGGGSSTASGEASSVSGGSLNVASGLWSSVSGGSLNVASGNGSSVSGGGGWVSPTPDGNEAIGNRSWIGGGRNNIAEADFSTISGGNGITVTEEDGWGTGCYSCP